MYPLTLLPSKQVSAIPKLTSLGHHRESRPKCKSRILHSVNSYFIMFLTLGHHVMTIIDCYVIINSFGDYYLDFQLVTENVSDVFK